MLIKQQSFKRRVFYYENIRNKTLSLFFRMGASEVEEVIVEATEVVAEEDGKFALPLTRSS